MDSVPRTTWRLITIPSSSCHILFQTFHYQIISNCSKCSGVYVKSFLTAVNLSFSLRTLAKEIPILETRLIFCSATGSPSTTLFRLRTDCVVLTYLFLRIFPNLFQVCNQELMKNQNFFFQEQTVKIEDINFLLKKIAL